MRLTKENIAQNKIHTNFNVPYASLFQLPEKVLQFGTGVLLRGLPDYYIDKANKQNIFNGRVVIVKSTGKDVDEFAKQDCLYTQCIKGIDNGNTVEEYIINAAVSKVVSAQTDWKEILKYAESADMQIIISNTTEVGLSLKEDDDIHADPPESFPGKLLAFLYKRFKHFNGSIESGMVIIPTELIVDNGKLLKKYLLQLATANNLETSFIEWISNANDFCSSLVDRIIPGALKKDEQIAFEQLAGYTDNLALMGEPYNLWAIETSSEKTKNILSFSKVDSNVIIADNIQKYRELKLRLLNGTHTYNCGLAYLAGFNLVSDATHNKTLLAFMKRLMMQEILPCITGKNITEEEATAFGNKVIERFSNLFIEHKWINITIQYTTKMKNRNIPLILEYYKRKNELPECMCAYFAAYILFMRPTHEKDGVYYGMYKGNQYKIDDTKAGYFYALDQEYDVYTIAEKVLADKDLWSNDLSVVKGLVQKVQYFIRHFQEESFLNVIEDILKEGNNISA
jgi:tagaturonate reductase